MAFIRSKPLKRRPKNACWGPGGRALRHFRLIFYEMFHDWSSRGRRCHAQMYMSLSTLHGIIAREKPLHEIIAREKKVQRWTILYSTVIKRTVQQRWYDQHSTTMVPRVAGHGLGNTRARRTNTAKRAPNMSMSMHRHRFMSGILCKSYFSVLWSLDFSSTPTRGVHFVGPNVQKKWPAKIPPEQLSLPC